jgi:outer membrane lipoprotein-sorting protein
MSAGRYALPEFGIAKGMERTLAAWEHAAARGALKVDYHGVQPVAEAGGVPCYTLKRKCEPPEEDGLTMVVTCFDTEHWLQVGNVLTGANDQRIAAYYFRDVVLNPDFPPDQFDASAVKRD